jgi:uncharacterized protein YkwD
MARRLKAAIVAGVAVLALAAIPSGASAAESCLYEGDDLRSTNQDDLELSLLCLTNVHRVKNGRTPLNLDTRLQAAARAHSADMVSRNYFDHISPEGIGPSGRAAAAGYPGGAGENIATNVEGTVFKLFDQWRASTAGHNENMLSANYLAAGFGVARGCCPGGPAGITGTQKFGLVPANTSENGLDLYASSERCAQAKLSLISRRAAKRKAKGKSARSQARKKVKSASRKVRRACDELPGT